MRSRQSCAKGTKGTTKLYIRSWVAVAQSVETWLGDRRVAGSLPQYGSRLVAEEVPAHFLDFCRGAPNPHNAPRALSQQPTALSSGVMHHPKSAWLDKNGGHITVDRVYMFESDSKPFLTASTLPLSITTNIGFSPHLSLHHPPFLIEVMNGGAVKAMLGTWAAPKGPPGSQDSLPTVSIDLLAAVTPKSLGGVRISLPALAPFLCIQTVCMQVCVYMTYDTYKCSRYILNEMCTIYFSLSMVKIFQRCSLGDTQGDAGSSDEAEITV